VRPGERVSHRYEIEGLAGSGGMASVYRARDLETGGAAALKVLHDRPPAADDRFAREADILAAIDHPAIVRYLERGVTAEGRAFLAMEWLEGEALAARLSRARLSIGDSVAVGVAVAQGLAAAHGRGIVHRDIKPQNLFLVRGEPASVKILDFGLARPVMDRVTRTGAAPGTPGYMAPEQARSEASVGPAADLFALGCVLFECVAGSPAFSGDHVMAIFAKLLLEDPPPLSDLRDSVPEDLERLVSALLAKAPEARPPSADAVARALSALGSERAASAPRPALGRSERRAVSLVAIRGPATAAFEDASGIERIARAHGAWFEPLPDGSAIAAFLADESASQAVRAVVCAMALRAESPRLAIAVVTGSAESPARARIGEAVERAARLLSRRQAVRTDIAVDDVTHGMLGTRFEVERDGSGWVLRGERDADEPRPLLGKASAFVGRHADLDLVDALLVQSADESTARVVLVTAGPGAGKSRLAQEIVRRARSRETPLGVWIGGGDPMSAGSAFHVVGRALRRAARIRDGEPIDVRRAKLRERVGRHLDGDAAERASAFLGEVVGAPFAAEARPELRAARADPMLMSDLIRAAFCDLFRAECAACPQLLVMEDLHWGDASSVALVDEALRALRDMPLIVLALARPEVADVFPRVWSRHDPVTVRLSPLSRRASTELVKAALGAGAGPDLVARLVDRAAGNPLFLEELARAAASGALGDAAPETVLALVQARLEALDPEARRVLRAASVFGESLWVEGVASLIGGPEHQAAAARVLEDLVQRELLAASGLGRFAGASELRFRHALVRDAAYAMLTEEDRTLGHRLAAVWLEGAGETEAVVLAEHLERGGEPARAAPHYLRAAEKALGGNDFAGVVARCESGVRCGAEGETFAELHLVESYARRWRGEIELACRASELAWTHFPAGSAPWFDAAAELAGGRLAGGGAEALRELGSHVLERLVASEVPSPRAVGGSARVALTLIALGSLDVADALLAECDRASARLPAPDGISEAWIRLTRSHRAAVDGDPAACLGHVEAAVREFERIGNVRTSCNARVIVGFAHAELGDFAEAARVLAHALADAERMDLSNVRAAVRQNLSKALMYLGRLPEARATICAAIADYRAQGDRRMLACSLAYFSDIQAREGQLEGAKAAAEESIEILGEGAPLAFYSKTILARVLLRQGRAREAVDLLGDVALGGEGTPHIEEGEAILRLVGAEALHAAGDHEGARAAIRLARDRLEDRAAKIRDVARRDGFLTNVPEHARTLELARAWLSQQR
jgi:eukaryotic-like serine/threonine-protein kinase